MFEYLRGKLDSIHPNWVVMEVSGIGYRVYIPTHLHARLPAPGAEILLYVSNVLREFSSTFYGFISSKERELFESVLSINGIGPKTAIAIVGCFSLSELQTIVETGDVSGLCKVPGVGKKTAERLLVDLRDKLVDCGADLEVISPSGQGSLQVIRDTMNALVHLGYTQLVAQRAVKKALEKIPDCKDAATLVACALQNP